MTEKSNELPEEGKVTPGSDNSEAKGKKTDTNTEGREDTGNQEIPEAKAEEKEVPVAVNSEDNDTEKSSSEGEKESEEESSATTESEEVSTSVEAKTDLASEKKTEEEKPEVISEESSSEETEDSEESTESEDEEDEEEEVVEIDLSALDKAGLLSLLKEKVGHELPQKVDKVIHEIKAAFQQYTNQERTEALDKFKSEGGEEDDFNFQPSEEEKEFDTHFFEFRRQLSSLRKNAEKQKERNFEAKNELLDKLRELVDGEETTLSINAIKSIQENWKSIGPVPSAQNRSLWANYNALMDRFYDNRSIYFELKELDRKKNLESKTELCEKAEALKGEEDLQTAIKILNELHEEYKHLGPVPREEQEALWQRFKSASDAVYDRRKEFYDSQKEVFQKNLELKEALINSLEDFTTFDAERIREWNSKTKEILAIQKAWEQIGPVPRESGREVNKKFWAGFKQFFHNKNLFFKKLDEIRAENQKKAEELIVKAEELMESLDWQKTANQMISLQKDWKTLGPTPEKTRDSLYKKFKKACDTFFDNRRNANKESNAEYEANLEKKNALCKEIEEAAVGESPSEEELTKFVSQFNELGFVPRKNMKEVQAKFKVAVDKYLEKLDLQGVGKDTFLFKLNLNKIQSDPNASKTFNKKEHGIRRQISDLENNITLWKTNLDFFAASKTADKLKDQFDIKIKKAEDEISKLKEKLSILRDF